VLEGLGSPELLRPTDDRETWLVLTRWRDDESFQALMHLDEVFGGAMMSTPFDLDLSVRPVLATGATCDVAEVDNRCAGGACAAGTCP